MRHLLPLLFLTVSLFARELSMNGTFYGEVHADGSLPNWRLNAWYGFQPTANLEILPDAGVVGNALRLSNVTAQYGAAVNSSFQWDVRSGDTVNLGFRARGRGKGLVKISFLTADKEWNPYSDEVVKFELQDQWREYSASFAIVNGPKGESCAFDVSIEIEKDAELELSDLHADVAEGRFRGSEPFPQLWKLYGPLPNDFIPSAEEFAEIPAELNGLPAKDYRLVEHTIDFAKLFGPGDEKVGWAFAALDSPIECDYTIGIGADWWCQLYLNGELLVNTMMTGNVEVPYEISNHVRTARLRKGRNIIAAKIKTGTGSSVMKLGGPRDLASRDTRIKLEKLDWVENFDDDAIACSGAPEVIQGYPAPGLLIPTGQGLFQTNETLAITQPAGAFALPENRAHFRAMGVRLQQFAREDEPAVDSTFALVFQKDADDFRLELVNTTADPILQIRVLENGMTIATRQYPRENLPADILVGANGHGQYAVMMTSLSGGSELSFAGDTSFFLNHPECTPALEFRKDDKATDHPARVLIDNFCVGTAQKKTLTSTVPFLVTPKPEFDPAKAGWKLAFDDEFDGDDVDMTRWEPGWGYNKDMTVVKDGLLEIRADWKDDTHTDRKTSSLKTAQRFLYGYFEARVKFTRTAGWWSAFWLYGDNNTNAFNDGFEIDIFEDYYLAALKEGDTARNVLDHNLHMYYGNTLKSWNFNSPVLEDLDRFYVIGCLWSPFEISYYLDGKLIAAKAQHSPFNSVTFDAFNHATGLSPLKCIVSGQVGKSGGDPKLGHFPDTYYVDYVRIYELPQENIPEVRWTKTPTVHTAHYGDTLRFSAEAAPSDKTHSPIRNAYLFDSGSLVAYKNAPPFDFEVTMTDEFYALTEYNHPGRQSLVPDLRENYHNFSIFVQDENGEVAHTDPWMLFPVKCGDYAGKPYRGKRHAVPGTIPLWQFDEGGEGVAYHDVTRWNIFAHNNEPTARPEEVVDVQGERIAATRPGEWLNYSVEIPEGGRYRVTITYANYIPEETGVYLLLDDEKYLGFFNMPWTGKVLYEPTREATLDAELPAGNHVLKLFLKGMPNLGKLNLERL